MEAAVAQNEDFKFTVSFNNAGLGYSVQSINGVTRDLDNSCFWTLSFKPYLDTKLKSSPVGISSYYPSLRAVVQWEHRQFQHDVNKQCWAYMDMHGIAISLLLHVFAYICVVLV